MPCQRLAPHAWLGCAAILVDFIGLGMIAPILPSIVAKQSVGNILTAQYLAVVVGQLVVAGMSDYFGRRRVIFAVMVFDALLFGSTGFTKDVTALIVLRLLAGFAAPVALGISYVASISFGLPPAKAQLNFAYVGMSFNLGTLIGAATGGLLGADLWLPANLVAGVVPAFVAIWALATLDTAEDREKWRQSLVASAVPAGDVAEATGDYMKVMQLVNAYQTCGSGWEKDAGRLTATCGLASPPRGLGSLLPVPGRRPSPLRSRAGRRGCAAALGRVERAPLVSPRLPSSPLVRSRGHSVATLDPLGMYAADLDDSVISSTFSRASCTLSRAPSRTLLVATTVALAA